MTTEPPINHVRRWLRERTRQSNSLIAFADAYKDYSDWTEKNAAFPVNYRQLGNALRWLGVPGSRDYKGSYLRIELLDTDAQPFYRPEPTATHPDQRATRVKAARIRGLFAR